MTRLGVVASVVAALIVGGAAAGFAIVWRPAIAAIPVPSPQFDPEMVKRGRVLAAIGNCKDCHTVRAEKEFAGGLAVPTPFGTIFSTNITPDPETGIGRWSEVAFRRAMRSGVDREGRHLYPTFPYDHFTHVSDDDDRALYAFLMTREPVVAPARHNELPFPLNQRLVVAGWKLLFLHSGAYEPDSTRSADWNRGAYLVEGLAHCGACHTPRNALGAERADARFSGGESEYWSAYAINAHSPAKVHWDAEALYFYLRNGWHPDHGTARGPMAQVVSNLSSVPASDVHAIATYMADVLGPQRPARNREATVGQAKSTAGENSQGAAIYAAACSLCHQNGRPLPYGGLGLALSTAVSAPDPRNLANIVLAGVLPVDGERSPIMPGFAASMNDAQIAALLTYLRSRFSDQPAWRDLERAVAEARRTQTAFFQMSAGPHSAPAE
jgi:mono/diheme cytochrome c family protein